MSNWERFEIFSDFILQTFPEARSIADIGGGNGHLNRTLKKKNNRLKVVTFDRRPRNQIPKGIDFRNEFFVDNKEFDLLVGLHPDGATQKIIQIGKKNNCSFAVIPCCIKDESYTGSGANWLNYLKSLVECSETFLPFKGRNAVLWRQF